MRFDLIARAGRAEPGDGAAQHAGHLGLARQDCSTGWWPLLVLGLLPVGFAMVWLVSGLGAKFQLYQLHKSFGVLVLSAGAGPAPLAVAEPACPGICRRDLQPWERRGGERSRTVASTSSCS